MHLSIWNKNIQYIFNKNTVKHIFGGSFFKFPKIYTVHWKTLSPLTSAIPHLWDGFTMKLICYQLKKEILRLELGGLAGGSRDVWIEYQRWSTNCSNQGHLGLYEMEKMLRNGLVPYLFVSGLLFSGKKSHPPEMNHPIKIVGTGTSNFVNKNRSNEAKD